VADEGIAIAQQRLAIRQAELKERQLDTEVRRPADAAKYQAEQEAASFLARRRAEAEARRADGMAEAESLEAAGRAEAAAVQAKAEAYGKFNDAAVLDRLVEVLPRIAHELAAPYANIKDLTVISNDGAGQLSKNVTSNINDTVTMLEKMTGVASRTRSRTGGDAPDRRGSRSGLASVRDRRREHSARGPGGRA